MRFGTPLLAAVGLVGVAALVALGNRQPPPAPAAGQPKAEAAATADEAAVRKSAQQFEEAFNKKDARAMAALWTENGELTDVDGTVVRGRAALEKMYAAAFAAAPKSKGKIEVEAVRPLGANLVTTEGTYRVTPADGKPAGVTRYTALYVREGDRWLTATVREAYPDGPAADKLTDLEWLIGDWEAKQDDRAVRTSYAWGDEKAFIVCKFRVTEKDQVVVSGTEILARDPSTGQIRGWLFDRSGTLAEAYWTRDGSQWVVEIAGTLPGGDELEATNAVIPAGPDAFTWVSVDRSAGGQPLPNAVPLKVTRVKK
jgi:uncharacterized protein (TIGR02246 family)